jgi:hypothetical protein
MLESSKRIQYKEGRKAGTALRGHHSLGFERGLGEVQQRSIR